MANLPSVKTLSQVFEEPKQARKILEMTKTQLMDLPACKEPLQFHGDWSKQSTLQLRMMALNALESGLHGIEYARMRRGTATYLNTGDMYASTLIYWDLNYRVQSLGDFIETQERAGNRAD